MSDSALLKILIAEDNAPTSALLTKFLHRHGHTVIVTDNGRQAVELYLSEQPDLILTDINMPIMSGLDAIPLIRQHATDTWIPIIILSALSDVEDVITGLESGADDYLSKPINLNILNAKIRSIARIVTLQNTNKETALKLTAANNDLEQEQLLAKKLADNMLALGDINHPNIQYWLCPNRHFSGDLIAASKTIGDKLYVMLADSTGHGLAASLPTLVMAKIFHTMSDKGFTLSSIAAEMNCSAKVMLTPERFVATALFAIDFHHQTIEYWNGSIPTALLVDDSGKIIHEFKSSNLAIGILPPAAFDARTKLFSWTHACELIVYSDGLTEVESNSDIAFGNKALLSIITSTAAGSRVSALKTKVLAHLQSEQGQDDISLLSVRCGMPVTE
jgi:CheY-like chemotaxis protein